MADIRLTIKKDNKQASQASSEEKTVAVLKTLWAPDEPKSHIDPKRTSFRFKLALVFIGLSSLAFWEFGLPYILQEISYVSQETSHKEQRQIELFNYKEQELAQLISRNESSDVKIDEIPLYNELIERLDQLIEISPSQFEYKESSAAFHTYVGLNSKDSNIAMAHFEKAQSIYLEHFTEKPDFYQSEDSQDLRNRLMEVKFFIEDLKEEAVDSTDIENNSVINVPQTFSGTWTEDRVETLEKMWVEGHSANQIAKELGGVTRNSVIGKIHRLGLSRRKVEPVIENP